MKRLRFLPALLLILSACSENIIEQTPSGDGEMGSVSIALSTDLRSDIVVTKAGAGEPDVDAFRIAIYKADDKKRLYNDSYANTKGREIKLNAGAYRLVAQLGDTLGCGFDKPYYMANPLFNVNGYNTQIEAVAKLANVKLAVEYDATFSENEEYSDYYTIVRHRNGKQIKFVKGETRHGYIPGGELFLEVWARIGGVWKVYEAPAVEYKPNDFVTFTITTNAAEGNLLININVDRTVEDKNETIEIPATAVPQDVPSITLAGFDGAGNSHAFVEGVADGANAMASFVAKASIAHCYLTVESEYLTSRGVPAMVDFTDLKSNEKTALNSVGFSWNADMATSRKLSYIDFSDVISSLLAVTRAKAQDETVARFTLKVEDAVGKYAESSFSIVSSAVNQTVTVADYNVWAKRIKSPAVTADKGDMSLLKLQVSSDGKAWTDFAGTPVQEGNTITYGTYEGTEPGATYYFRSIYNNNEDSVSPVLEVRTEEAAQVGNAGFEEYHMAVHTVKPLGSSYNRNWYLPYNQGDTNPWWACNSKQSMPDGHTTLSVTWVKNFPSSGYVNGDRDGNGKAALLYCVNVGDGNTQISPVGETFEGEIWIGTADDSGNRTHDGHAFSSRPSKLAFYYTYTDNDGKNFFVDAAVKDAAGETIATATETAGPAKSSWTRHELTFNYSNHEAKAAEIYIRFSSSYGDGSVGTKVQFKLGEETVNAHAGCFLKLDDIELIYE